MYRVPFMDNPQYREEAIYLSGGISANILRIIEQVVPLDARNEIELEMLYESCFEDFFAGTGKYLQVSDRAAGMEILDRKLKRMAQKLRSTVSYEPLDLLEQRILYECEEYLHDLVKDKMIKRKDVTDRGKILEAQEVLMERFGEEKDVAKRYAQAMYDGLCFTKDLKDEYEDTALVLDYDLVIFFGRSFVEGIEMLKSFAGEALGYGYDYACAIFSDIDITPPLSLLGTAEANRIANEASLREYREEQERAAKEEAEFELDETIGKMLNNPDYHPEEINDDDLPFS